jgi:excinuclease ABC subunit A
VVEDPYGVPLMPSPHRPHGDDPSVRDGYIDGYIRVRDAREHNLQGMNVDIPREVVAVFTGVSGSGRSSPAFGTICAEAQPAASGRSRRTRVG